MMLFTISADIARHDGKKISRASQEEICDRIKELLQDADWEVNDDIFADVKNVVITESRPAR